MKQNYLKKLIADTDYKSITNLDYSDFEYMIKNDDYETFEGIMILARNNNLKINSLNENYLKIIEISKIYDHLLWLKNIPNFDHTYDFDINIRINMIVKLIKDSSIVDELSNIIENMINTRNEREIINLIKRLPNYDVNNFYKNLNELIVYHICGLYLSLSEKYDKNRSIEKLNNFIK